MPQTEKPNIEVLENNKARLTLRVSPERFEEGLEHAYKEQRGKINLPGFRNGRAPRKLIEIQYGKDIFYEDALDYVLPDIYRDFIYDNDIDAVSRPQYEVVEADAAAGAVVTAEVTLKPEVSVSGYIGIEYEKINVEVTEDEINADIEKNREKNARFVPVAERPLQDGDIADIDFEGFVDGVAFEGGKGTGYELVLGSGTFIPGFEDQLIGKNIGEDVTVNVTFPEEYKAEHLKGKPAVFEVKINGARLKELPEVNDGFAQDVSDFETLAEYKEDIKATLMKMKEHEAEHDREDKVLRVLIERTAADIPEVMIETEIDAMVDNFASYTRRQGVQLESYLNYTGTSMEMLRASYKEQAERGVKTRLALEAVAKKENVEISEEELDAEVARMAEAYKVDIESFANIMGKSERKALALDIMVQKAHKIIMDGAVEKPAPAEKRED